MLDLAHHYPELVTSSGRPYRARVYGRVQEDGTWAGFIVFFPVGAGQVISTDRETTQSSFADLSYWASGLTHAYLVDALDRALALQPEVELARELDELERIEGAATARADALDAAASAAEADARLAGAARESAEERLLETVADRAATEAAVHQRAADAARGEAELAEHALRGRRPRPSHTGATAAAPAKQSRTSKKEAPRKKARKQA